MSKGWIKLHRSLFENDLWTAEPFTKGQAWIDLIGNANHAPSTLWIRDIEVPVERGQIAWSELKMAKRWSWSRGKVRRYLDVLKVRGMIVQQTNTVTSVLTICKYNYFQDSEKSNETETVQQTVQPSEQQTEQQTIQQTVQQTVHKQECKELKNVNKKDLSAPDKPDAAQSVFDYWCHRMSKGSQTKFSPKRRRAVQARLKDGRSVDDIKKAIDGCAASPFNMGIGDGSDGTVYDDLELICRNNENLERFMQIYERPPARKITSTDTDILGDTTW